MEPGGIEQPDLDLPILPLFSQLNVKVAGESNKSEWKETSRWVKFQEDVEDGGKRWSKPFVPSLPLAAILDVKQCFNSGIVAFDVRGTNIVDILGKYTVFFSCVHLKKSEKNPKKIRIF